MRFTLAGFETAVTDRVSRRVGSRVRAVAEVSEPDAAPDALIPYDRAARLLMAATFDASPADALAAADGLTLTAAQIAADGRQVTLTPEEALAHPLLSRWVAANLSDTVSKIVVVGLLLSTVGLDSPEYRTIDVVCAESAPPMAVVEMAFESVFDGGAVVTLTFGQPLGLVPWSSAQRLNGDLISQLGTFAQLETSLIAMQLVQAAAQSEAATVH